MKEVILNPKSFYTDADVTQNAKETWEGKLEVERKTGSIITITVIGPKPRGSESFKHCISLSNGEADALSFALKVV